jgi:hypothetical protein
MASTPRHSAAFSPDVVAEIERAADEGLYRIRGFGTLRPLPSFDDLVLLAPRCRVIRSRAIASAAQPT